MASSSGTSGSWSPDALLDEPTRDRAPRTSAAYADGGDDDHEDVSAERVTSRLRKPGALRALCKKYSIPDGFAPVLAGDRSSCSTPPPGSVCVYLDSLDAGMRLPLHPFFAAVLNHFGLAPGQLSPNGWRAMAGFVALSRSAGVDPSLAVFRHFFALCPFPPHGFYTLRGKDANGLLFVRIRAKFIKGWKEDFFFLESLSAPWPCPVEWGEPSRSSTFDPSLTAQEKAVADSLLRARGSSPIDLFAYLHHRNMAAASIIGVPSPPPTAKAAPVHVAMEEAAAARALPGKVKVTVKSEPDYKVPPCAPSPGKKRKLPEDRADGESSASDPSCPPGFSSPWLSPPATSKDGDWKAARQLLQGIVTPSRERELAASKPADVVASTYVSLLQTANEVAFSLGYALELEEKLRARERKADALQGELHRKLKARELDETTKAATAAREELCREMKVRERDTDALREELSRAKAVLAETKADAGIAAAAARGLREELDKNVKARERDAAESDALRAELHEAKAELAATKAEAERAAAARWFWGSSREHARALAERELRGYERGLEDMRRAALRRYPYLDPSLLFVPVSGPP